VPNRAASAPTKPRARTGRVTAKSVVDTAERLADTEGIDAVSLTRIAAELGVTQPSIYRHINGIQELKKAMVLRARELLVADLREAAIGHTRDEAVLAVATAWRHYVRVHPGLYDATDRIATAGDTDLEASLDNVVHVLAMSMKGYRLAPDEQVHSARSIRSALHGFVALEKDAGHPAGAGLDESFERLVALLVAGIRAMELPPANGTAAPRRK
jgi:AcrR family transcriptional regulator